MSVFESEIVGHRHNMGDLYVVIGAFTNEGGATGGTVKTGLGKVVFAIAQHTGAAVAGDAPSFNETFPTTDGDILLVTTANANGIWIAYGIA